MRFSNQDLKKLIIPLLIEQVLSISIGVADTIMVSQVGEAAVSGVSLVDMINVLIIQAFAALATGGAVVCAQFIGQKREDLACRSADQLVLISSVISIVIMMVCLIFRRGIIRAAFGVLEPDVLNNALSYLMITSISFPFLAVYNSCAALFRAMGNSRISMLTSLCMNVINIGGNAVLIFGFHFGVEGVAIPSLISRAAAAVIMVVLIRRPSVPVHISPRPCVHFDLLMIKRILNIGIPSGLESGFFNFGKIIVISIIASFGTAQIAANAVANNIDNICCIPGNAVGLAMITVIGQCVGAGDVEQVRYYTKKLMKICYAGAAVLILSVLLVLPWVLNLYQLSDETMRIAKILIYMHNITALFIWPLSFALPNMLRACNDVRYTMMVSIFSMCVVRILFSYLLGKYLSYGAVGVWAAMLLDWIVRMTFFLFRYRGGTWKKTMLQYVG